MKHIRTSKQRGKFEVLISTREAQAAMMTLQPGDASEKEPHNEHPQSEQWLLVISGSGKAVAKQGAKRRSIALAAGSLLLVEKRELHQIKNSGDVALVTINFYVPPAYTEDGEPKKRK
jgi:mannose-6-phosphate isomerase-like protein (cupin superfamily)